MIRKDQKGFTILELMIATSIFSVILLICAFGLIQIGRIYYKGITSSRTQATARAISDDMTQAIQYGGKNVQLTYDPTGTPPILALSQDGGTRTVTVGNRSYTYTLGRMLVDGTPSGREATSVLKVQDLDDNGNPVGATRELMSPRMWLSRFDITAGGAAFKVDIQVVSGDVDLVEDGAKVEFGTGGFNPATLRCKPKAGSQFCAVSGLYTEVVRRL